MSGNQDWISILNALLVPTIAALGILLTALNYRLSLRKRKDDLFDRRYDFFCRVNHLWRFSGEISENGPRPELDVGDIEDFACEAEFLFGNDIANHLRSYVGKKYDNFWWQPDREFLLPFKKYLSME